jgi:hypothetical protein
MSPPQKLNYEGGSHPSDAMAALPYLQGTNEKGLTGKTGKWQQDRWRS